MFEVIGYVSIFLSLLATQFLCCKKATAVAGAGSLLYAVHIFMLGSFSAVLYSVLAVVRDMPSLVLEEKTYKLYAALLGGVIVLLCFLCIQGPADIANFSIALFVTISRQFQHKFIVYKLCLLLSTSSWLVFGLLMGSLPTLIVCMCLILSHAISILRFYIPSIDTYFISLQPLKNLR